MNTLVVHMTQERVTKNKVRYHQDDEEDPIVKDVYINKEAIDGNYPEAIKVTIEQE